MHVSLINTVKPIQCIIKPQIQNAIKDINLKRGSLKGLLSSGYLSLKTTRAIGVTDNVTT